MSLQQTKNYLDNLTPIDKVPVTWECTGYTSPGFNRWAAGAAFQGLPSETAANKEAATIARLLEVRSGQSLLDVACGYGRHAVIFAAQYGLQVAGVDVSPGLIAAAERIARERGLSIRYELCHARDLKWAEEFDHAMIAFNSFSLFSPDDAPAVLRAICRALKRNGRLFLDLDNKPFNQRKGSAYRDWRTWPHGINLQEVYFHENTSVEVDRDLTVRSDTGEVEEFTIFKRIYTRLEIKDLLQRAGFDTTYICGSWDLLPLDNDSPKMIVAAQKRAGIRV
jgi:SAM-dependent methyltransferase